MRRFALPTLALATVLIGTGCEQSESPTVLEPAFAKVFDLTNPCPSILGDESDTDHTSKWEVALALYQWIDPLFKDVRSRNAAKTHLSNIVDAVCAGDYDGAASALHTFIQQVEGQPDIMLADAPSDQDLISWASVLAMEMDNETLPEGILEVEGGLAFVPDATGAGTVKTRNGHVLVNASDFPPGGPFFVAIAPGGAGDFGDYVVYGDELYQIVTDASSTNPDGVLVSFCPVAENGEPPQEYPGYLKIAHDKGDAVELLETWTSQCGESQSALLQGAQGWLRSLARYAGGAIRNVFGPTPVYARAETGLGGRTKSFSPFAVVNPWTALRVEVTGPEGVSAVDVGGTAQFAATLTGPQDAVDLYMQLYGEDYTWSSGNLKWLQVGSTGLATGWAESVGSVEVKATLPPQGEVPELTGSTSISVNPLADPVVGFSASRIGEYGETNSYDFSWSGDTYPALLFTAADAGNCAAGTYRTSLIADPAQVESSCLAGAVAPGMLTAFSISTGAGSPPPASVTAKLHDSFALAAGKDYTSNAAYVTVQTNNLSVSKTGDGDGTIGCQVRGTDGKFTPCGSYQFQDWQDVKLTATPDAWSRFDGWTGPCSPLVTGDCAFRMREDRSITATFTKVYAPLTVVCESRLAGSVSVSYDGAEVCAASEDSQTSNTVLVPIGSVSITAEPVGYTGKDDFWFSSEDLALDAALCSPKVSGNKGSAATCTFSMPGAGGTLNVKLTSF